MPEFVRWIPGVRIVPEVKPLACFLLAGSCTVDYKGIVFLSNVQSERAVNFEP
jgi:hypothetical protein